MHPRSLVLALLLVVSFSAFAQSSDVSGGLGLWSSDRQGNAAALGLSYNRYWTGLVSTRIGGLFARDPQATTLMAHLNGELHFLRDARVSPWVGAGVAFAYSHLAPSNQHFTGNETDVSPMYSGGVDFRVSPRLAVGAEVSFLNYEVTIGQNRRAVDPVIVMLMARYRL